MNKNLSPSDVQDELVIRMWDNEDVLGEMVIHYADKVFEGITRAYPILNHDETEDIVAEVIQRFWSSRHNYRHEGSLQAYLYRIACNVANEYISGRLKWQLQRNNEIAVEPDLLEIKCQVDESDSNLDELEDKNPELFEALRITVQNLPEIQREIIWAYAMAGDYELDAGKLGIELGFKYKSGVPIPAGTVRQYKKRAKEKIIQELSKGGFNWRRIGYDGDA